MRKGEARANALIRSTEDPNNKYMAFARRNGNDVDYYVEIRDNDIYMDSMFINGEMKYIRSRPSRF